MTKSYKRIDKKGRILKTGEYERANGIYEYKYQIKGERNSVYAPTLNELRQKEESIIHDRCDGIRGNAKKITLDEVYNIWIKEKKTTVVDTTLQNNAFYYNHFIKERFGRWKIVDINKSDIRSFYNSLIESRQLKLNTLDGVQSVMHSMLKLCCENNWLRVNPSDDALRQIKQSRILKTEKRRALTVQQQQILLDYLNRHNSRFKNMIIIFMGTAMRCSELTGLTWDDVDFENNLIYVRRDLVYYLHEDTKCYYEINPTKTLTSERVIPMIDSVRQAFLDEKKYNEMTGIKCTMTIRGVSNFCLVNKEGRVYNQSCINRGLKRLIRDINFEILDKNPNATEDELIPQTLSTHIFRHTAATRLLENNASLPFIAEFLGHKSTEVTADVYCDILKEYRKKEAEKFNSYLNNIIRSNTTSYDIPYDKIIENGVKRCEIA